MGKLKLHSLCMVFVLLCGIAFSAYAEEPVSVTLRPGTLSGTLTDAKGVAIPDKPVVLMRDGKAIGSVTTDEFGKYIFEGVEPGTYEIVVPGAPPLKFVVAADGTASTLTLMLPEGAPAASGVAAGSGLSNTQWVWVGVGAGAIAVAVPIVAASSGGSSGGSTHSE